MATWYCALCKKHLDHMGVPRHRQMHRDRGDGPFTMHSETTNYTYDYRASEEASDGGRT